MRSSTKLLLTLFFFGVALAPAQTIPAGTFKHIIIIVQENRTPDNLFGAAPRIGGCSQEDPFEPGVDIENGGYVKGTQQPICNASLPMNMGLQFDPGHLNGDWVDDYDSGHMDGFCDRYAPPTYCPTYSYVQKSDVQPYFDIATGYGFANYMFQTNQGPSFPAHQFLFTGTSAPVAPKDPNNYYLDFIADNAGFTDSGCPYDGIANGWPGWVIPNGTPEEDPRTNKSECYTHDSLVPIPTATRVRAGATTLQPPVSSGTRQQESQRSAMGTTKTTTAHAPPMNLRITSNSPPSRMARPYSTTLRIALCSKLAG